MLTNRSGYYIVVVTKNIKKSRKTVDVEYFKRRF